MSERGSFTDVLAGFGVIWAVTMIVAFPTLIIANGIFAVPLYQVVNVKMSLVLFAVAIGLALTGMNFLLSLAMGQIQSVFAALFLALFLVVLPFGPIAACQFYAWVGGLEITGKSFVYDGFVQIFFNFATFLSAWLGGGGVSTPMGQMSAPGTVAFGLTLQEITNVAIILNVVIGLILAILGLRRFELPSYRD